MDMMRVRKAAQRYREYLMPPYDAMMAMDGFDAICEFANTFNGQNLYIPTVKSIFLPCIEADIAERYTGTNASALTKCYGFTGRTIRRIAERNG